MIHHVLAAPARAADRPISPVTGEAMATAIFKNQQRYVLGCIFAPLIVDILLLGVLLTQVYTYFTCQKDDRWMTKAVVLTVLFINLCFSAYLTYFIQWLFVENFGLWAPFFNTKRLAWGPFIDALNSFVVQTFMSYRAYRLLNRLIWIPVAVTALCLISVGATLSVLIIFFNLNSLIDAYRVKIPELLWLTSIVCADLIITISIIYGLIKSKTGWAHTHKILSKLVRMTIEGQVPPLLIALLFMVEFSGAEVFVPRNQTKPDQLQVKVETGTTLNGPYSNYAGNRKAADSFSITDHSGVAYSSQAQLTA